MGHTDVLVAVVYLALARGLVFFPVHLESRTEDAEK